MSNNGIYEWKVITIRIGYSYDQVLLEKLLNDNWTMERSYKEDETVMFFFRKLVIE